MRIIQKPQSGDLVLLVADKNMEAALSGILEHPPALGIRPVIWRIEVDERSNDPGVLKRSGERAVQFRQTFSHLIAIFDYEGCGQERKRTPIQLEHDLEQRIVKHGWNTDQVAAICIAPELEQWFWSDSPHVANALGWTDQQLDLRLWLQERNLWQEKQLKPHNPKKAVEDALHYVRLPRSSDIYKTLAEQLTVHSKSCVRSYTPGFRSPRHHDIAKAFRLHTSGGTHPCPHP